MEPLLDLYRHATKTSVYTPILVFAYMVFKHQSFWQYWVLLFFSLIVAAEVMLIEHRYKPLQKVTWQKIASDVKLMSTQQKESNFFLLLLYSVLFVSALIALIYELKINFELMPFALLIIACLGITLRLIYFFENKTVILENFK